MNAMINIPRYRDKAKQKGSQEDMVTKALLRENKRLKRKNRKLKAKRAEEEASRKLAEYELEQEQIDAARREMRIRIQTKLDDYAFYCDDSQEAKLR